MLGSSTQSFRAEGWRVKVLGGHMGAGAKHSRQTNRMSKLLSSNVMAALQNVRQDMLQNQFLQRARAPDSS